MITALRRYLARRRRWQRVLAFRNRYSIFPTMREIINDVQREIWKLRLYAEQRRIDEGHRARMMAIERSRRQLHELTERLRRELGL